MAATSKRTFSLPAEQSRYINTLVESGRYATSSEVIRSGLRALQERDAAVERWLRDEVVPVAAAMRSDPSQAIPIDSVFDEPRALHVGRPAGADRVVGAYLSASELEHYERLKARERQVLLVGALSDEVIADIEAAEYGVETP